MDKKRILSNQDLPILLEEFNYNDEKIKSLEKNRVYLLKSIITHKCPNEIGDWKVFMDYFYAHNKKLIKLEKKFEKIISSPSKFKIIHGYSKSGKTTFIRKVIYNLMQERKILFVDFDFEKGTTFSSYTNKVKDLIKNKFNPYGIKKRVDIIKRISLYNKFIDEFFKNLDEQNKIETLRIVYDVLSTVKNNFNLYIKNTYGGRNLNEEEINEEFDKYITNNIEPDNVHTYLIYLTFFRIIDKHDDLLEDQDIEIIITFDNLDENMSDNDISFLKQPQTKFSDFLYTVFEKEKKINSIFTKSLLNVLEVDTELTINFNDQIKVIYVFRTSNFLVFANLLQNQMLNPRPYAQFLAKNLHDKREILHFKSISNTSNILEMRLNIFENIIRLIYGNSYHKFLPAGFSLLKKLAANLDNINDIEQAFDNNNIELNKAIKHIFNLWNGDNVELFKAFSKYFDEIINYYGKNETIIEHIDKVCFEGKNVILRGIYLHFFLFLYKKSLLNENSKIFEYAITSFLDKKKGKVKNINRMILNLIINKTISNGRANSIDDILDKGIGFYDLLSNIEAFIKEIDNISPNTYSFNDVIKFFNELSSVNISSYNNLFSIYKNQIIYNDKNDLVLSNKYILAKEIEEYQLRGDKSKNKLNKIRLFSNHNAMFISSELLTEFELYSFIKGTKQPLLLLFNKSKDIDTNINKFLEEVESIKVYTLEVMDNMVSFYIDNLIYYSNPNDFVNNQLFSLLNFNKENKGRFQFRQTISRHITYLNFTRYYLLNYCDHLFNHSHKIKLNISLKKLVSNYCDNYINNYNRIIEIEHIEKINPRHMLKSAFNAFTDMKNTIENMADDDFSLIKIKYA